MSLQESQQTSGSLLSDLFQVRYSLSDYQQADSWCEECSHRISSRCDKDIIFSITTTNVIRDILTVDIVQPIEHIQNFHARILATTTNLDAELIHRIVEIVSRVFSFISETSPKQSDLPHFRAELRSRTLNIFYSCFPSVCNDFVAFFKKTQESEQAEDASVMPYIEHICDGVACECFRRLSEVRIPFDPPFAASLYKLLVAVEKAKGMAVCEASQRDKRGPSVSQK